MTLQQLAMQIADESSISTIECNCNHVLSSDRKLLWYDTGSADEYAAWDVERAVRCLKLRGRLRVKPTNPLLVKPTAEVHR